MIIKMKILMTYVLGLCVADSVTTLAVIKSGIGYEANSAVSTIVTYPLFHVLKFIFTLAIVYFIHKTCKNDRRLEVASYLTLIIFYSMVVLNNILVYTFKFGFGLDLPKMFTIFGSIFAVTYISIMHTGSHQMYIE